MENKVIFRSPIPIDEAWEKAARAAIKDTERVFGIKQRSSQQFCECFDGVLKSMPVDFSCQLRNNS